MFARLTTTQGRPEQIDDARRVVENDVIPGAKMLSGFTGGYWLVDRKTGKGVTLTLFKTEEDLKTSEVAAQKLRTQATEKLGAEIKSVETYEVIAKA
jgi:hypothetical protein